MGPRERIFITGANGYIGSTITEFAVTDGYEVYGLSRSQSGDSKLKSLGAVPIRGDLTSLGVLRQQASEADMVIHLATAYRLGDCYEDLMPMDMAALDAMAEPLAGTSKPLVVTGGTLFYAADPLGAETNELSPPHPNPINTRQKGRAGEVYNASGATGVTAGQLYQAMAAALNLSVVGISSEEASATFGPALTTFFSRENRASGLKAKEELGWRPTGTGILDEIKTGSYQPVAASLRSQ